MCWVEVNAKMPSHQPGWGNDRFTGNPRLLGLFFAKPAKPGRIRATLRGHTKSVGELEFSRDGTLLVSTAADGTARLWDANGGILIRVFEHSLSH